jgi:cobalt/nickel transport system permease protein
MHGYRSIANLVGMLFVRSSDRSETIYKAMVLRGFVRTFWTIDHFHMHRSDWFAAAAMSALILCMIVLQIP